MRVETALIQRALVADGELDSDIQPWSIKAELRAWGRLFHHKYRDRTMVGVLIMVFQREFLSFFANLRLPT